MAYGVAEVPNALDTSRLSAARARCRSVGRDHTQPTSTKLNQREEQSESKADISRPDERSGRIRFDLRDDVLRVG